MNMKKISVLASILCLFVTNSFSESLKIADLDKCLSYGTSGQMNNYLTARGWDFYEQELQDDASEGGKKLHMTWAYWDDLEDRFSDIANAWIYADISQMGEGKISLIEYHCVNMEDYSVFAKSLESSNYKFVRNLDYDEYGEKRDAYIRSIYQSQNNILWIESYKDEGYYNNNKKTITRWVIYISPKEGRLDPSNGHKKFYLKGGLINDFQLKDNFLINEIKTYFANGKPYEILHIKSNSWVVDKYDYKGNKVSSLIISSKGLQKIIEFKDYYLQAKGTYVEYTDDLRRQYDAQYAPSAEKKYEGVFAIRIFVSRAGIHVNKTDSLNSHDNYTMTEYEYDTKYCIKSYSITQYISGKKTETSTYDDKNKLIRKIIYRGELADSHSWGYDENTIVEERIEHFKNNERDGECTNISYRPNGVKIVKIDVYQQGRLDGYCYQESYINGERQIDKYGTYHNGKLNGKCLDITGDSVIYAIYKDGEVEHVRLFKDDMMHFRSPQYILTDTAKLTLIADASLIDGEISKMASYYPGYFSDTIKMIKGKHAGELQYTIDYENGVYTKYSDFEIEYVDSTYRSYFLETHIDPVTHKKNGLTTYKDSLGNYIHVKNFKNGFNDGWSMYYRVPYCDGEFKALFNNGIWVKSIYNSIDGYLIEIQKISMSTICVLTYTNNDRLARKDYYIVNSKVINGFNNENWVNIFKLNDTYKTDEFYTYDEEGRITSFRNKDSNFIVYNNYDQFVTYWVHKAKAVPERYYELNSQDYMTGTITLDIDNDTSEVIKIKKGYRDGVTKVINNKTGKVIRKIKYSKGKAK